MLPSDFKHFPCKVRGKTAKETNLLLHERQKHPSGLQIVSLWPSHPLPPAVIISLFTKQHPIMNEMCVPVCDPPGRKLTVALRRKGNKRGWWAFFHLTLWNRQIDLAGNISRSRDLCWQAFRIIIQYESFCSDPLHSDAATVYMYHGIMFSSCPSVPFSGTQHLRNTLRKFYQCLIGLEDWTNCILGDEGQRSLWPHKAGFRPWWQL